MKLKTPKSRKPGTCSLARCKAQAVDLLCPEHEQAWRDAGSPALEPAPEPAALVPVSIQPGLAQERHTAQECLDLIANVPLHTQEDRDAMAGFVRKAQDMTKELETRRVEVTGPLNQALRTINGWFKPVRDLYQAIEQAGKTRLAQDMLQAQKAQDQALAAVQAAGGQAEASTLMLAHASPEAPAGMNARETWRFTVTDPDRVPDEYWMLDLTKIGQVVKTLGPEADIPGIRIERDLVMVRGRV